MRARRIGLSLLAPAAAIVLSLIISSLALWASGNNPFHAYNVMIHFAARTDSVISMLNRAIPLYVAGLAVAVGFKMNLFNIGVEGQYRLAALLAAAAGAAVHLPAFIHVPFIVIVAMAVGAAWAGVAGVLKVTRGVHEVISTIMLNFIATGLAAYMLANWFKAENPPGDLLLKTDAIPPSGLIPSLNSWLRAIGVAVPSGSNLQGFLLAAAAAGVVLWFVITRTRFGFDLRASGINPQAARASGVNAGSMVVKTMLLSGAIAGLVGVSQLLGFFGRYTIDFPTGLGFTGIAVALLGRNHPVGIAFGALLFGFLDRSAQVLDLEGIPKEIVIIMQGVILLSVVVAYEVVRRLVEAQQVRAAAQAVAGAELAEALP